MMTGDVEAGYFSRRPGRAAIEVSGPEAGLFLNDILTAQLETLPAGQMTAACLLSPQGRILFDMQVLRLSETLFWLVTESDQASRLVGKLRLYRLRRPLVIELLTPFSAAQIYQYAGLPDSPEGVFVFPDQRQPGLGSLLVARSDQLACPSGFAEQDETVWQAKRIAAAVPEGAADLTPDRALMLEAGLDHLGAVDFDKGCYIGQEVTARTRWRGLVKRRIVPVQCSAELHQQSPVLQAGKQVGQILSCVAMAGGWLGLASLRLAAIEAAETGEQPILADDQPLALAIPDWMRPLPQQK